MFDVWLALGAGVLGYVMRKVNWPVGTLLLGFILGPIVEDSLRQSLSMGGPKIFFTHPISAIFLLSTVLIIVISLKFLRRVQKGF
jgi:putative tricarboxylic transport membrane protein